jgi:pfkB family carbohydrate kinase
MNKRGGLEKENQAGPAFFIEKVLKKNNLKYKLNHSQLIEILIKLDRHGESGKIKNQNIKVKKINKVKEGDVLLVSTVKDEWALPKKIPSQVKIFLDVQGYLRGSKFINDINGRNQLSKIFCLKGTEKELSKFPKRLLNSFKHKCLIITKGQKGSVIYNQNKRSVIVPDRMIKPKNTIGAGDTFFANFVANFLETNDAAASGRFATRETEKFLLTKGN